MARNAITTSRLLHLFTAVGIAIFLVVGIAQSAAASGDRFDDGANALFIGHSFFVPIAKSFDTLATENRFPGHKSQMVFASGPKGTPGALWDDQRRKERVIEILATGEIELFGMTTASNRGAGGALEAYQRWIDVALQYNPDTQIFIGHSWVPGGPRMDADRFAQSNVQIGEGAYAEVVELRQRNPGLTIHFVNYGEVASIMRAMFDAGELTDVTELTASGGRQGRGSRSRGEGRQGLRARILGRRQQSDGGEEAPAQSGPNLDGVQSALFADAGIGHAGPMMTQMSALVWLHFLYGSDVADLAPASWDRTDVEEITSEAIRSNRQYTP